MKGALRTGTANRICGNWKLDFTGFQPEFTRNNYPKNLFYSKSVFKVRYAFQSYMLNLN
jgi:hypothetical protein